MELRRYSKLLCGLIAVIIIGATLTLGISISNSLNSTSGLSTPVLQADSFNHGPSASAITPTLETIVAPTTPTLAATPTLIPGTVIKLPSSSSIGLKLVSTPDLPLISLDSAKQAVYNLGISWAKGGQVNGKTVILSATYGLATFGGLAKDGKTWVGAVNFPVRNCNDAGVCTDTGQVLDHIENRLMWILDYGNTIMLAGGPAPNSCQPVACTPFPDFDHSVYAVDAQTKDVIRIWFYYGS